MPQSQSSAPVPVSRGGNLTTFVASQFKKKKKKRQQKSKAKTKKEKNMLHIDDENYDPDQTACNSSTPKYKGNGKPNKVTPSPKRIPRRHSSTFANFPNPLSPSMWAEPDANSFKVRGKHYKKDKLKFNAGKSVFRLVAVDLVEVSDLIRGSFCAHPKERLQQALARECESSGDDPDLAPFYFVINMLMPGPPFYHMVYYYAVDDMSNINGSDGTPFSKLANEFFFGKSDEFRDNTFKLIPQIVDGNFIVRRAVGSTPAILGTKLKQYYFCTDRYFELMVDISSSSVAAGVVRLSVGYVSGILVYWFC